MVNGFNVLSESLCPLSNMGVKISVYIIKYDALLYGQLIKSARVVVDKYKL